jgi:muramoyltetrapeptide carboxypeptidase
VHGRTAPNRSTATAARANLPAGAACSVGVTAKNCYACTVRVRIEGASSPFPPERFAAGLDRLRALGFDVDARFAGPRGRHAYLNGSDDERRTSLQEALHSDVDVVWLARGGYGLGRIVDDLVVPPPAARVPWVVGFSDATALFCRLVNAGHAERCVHGPLATTIPAEPDDTVARLRDVFAGRRPAPLGGLRAVGATDVVDVAGPLFAGNLCVVASLCGTTSQPRLQSALAGAVVVLEEIGERPYRIDRLLTQLVRSSVLVDVAAVVVGHLTQCDEPSSSSSTSSSSSSSSASSFSARDAVPTPLQVFVDVLAPLGIPVVAGLASGHEAPNAPLPLGGRVRLRGQGANVALTWESPATVTT